jgi:hypothetical protein
MGGARHEPIADARDDRFMRTLALGLALMSNEPPPEVADPEPRRGHVAVGLGIAGIVAGAPMVLTGGVFLLNPGRPPMPSAGVQQPPPIGPIILGTGIATATLGAVGVIVGAHLNGKWKAWVARNPGRVSRLQLAPTGWAGRESFGFAIAGRF